MIDPRFYLLRGPIAVANLAGGGRVQGNETRVVSGVASFDAAGPDDLAYFDGKGIAPKSTAGAILLREGAANSSHDGSTLIFCTEPRAAFARLAHRIAVPREFAAGAPAVDPTAIIEESAILSPGAVVGPDARVGAGTLVGANAVIGPGVAIGRRCRIGPAAVLSCALVGDDVTLLPGALIGQNGFGVAADALGPVDIPHFGRVIVQDGASIGAGVTVDRGLFGDTVIGELAKIDNLCQIAHNVTVGRGAIIAAFGGISGSVTIGDGAMMGGRVGVADHRSIGRGAILAAGSAVMHDVPAGETWAGYPAKPLRQWLREVAWLGRAIGKRDGGQG
ncbi:MAG: UDP-3-O-(3-hydroxymyristoyl)glucosamine N-acyltransferase [Hyphomonadaceae bacterium]|nr:MAG: UDP-3-O-3-hydroxymyristoyl glucosamine N-acyltransferase [Caulobacteraceae bacterium]MBT9445069.1 UDP-3-O-(3-hydroxymyristoyl)glucosamine N-acyltransferase [Hyphomonadaceae bacterium]TPW08923.1 MAG: UDP-3-O-3-hydroxymyristoyl glucosamine N-acyltransferase [Alphaproteobacteria bacterium]